MYWLDFGNVPIKEGRNMAAILKNLKIALSSLILIRFTPFFPQNARNVNRNKQRASDVWDLIQYGRNKAAILKNLKIALSSLILVRFTHFFRQNADNLKGKKCRTSHLWNLTRSREIAILISLGLFLHMIIKLQSRFPARSYKSEVLHLFPLRFRAFWWKNGVNRINIKEDRAILRFFKMAAIFGPSCIRFFFKLIGAKILT